MLKYFITIPKKWLALCQSELKFAFAILQVSGTNTKSHLVCDSVLLVLQVDSDALLFFENNYSEWYYGKFLLFYKVSTDLWYSPKYYTLAAPDSFHFQSYFWGSKSLTDLGLAFSYIQKLSTMYIKSIHRRKIFYAGFFCLFVHFVFVFKMEHPQAKLVYSFCLKISSA